MLKPLMLRAEPLITPSTVLSMMVGRQYMIHQPGSDDPDDTEMPVRVVQHQAGAVFVFHIRSSCWSASSMVLTSVSLLLELISSSLTAHILASSSFSAIRRETATAASPMRPAALMRGPRENTMWEG
jgi:hypothetical protein